MPLPAMAQSLRIVVTRTERHGELVAIFFFCEVVKWSVSFDRFAKLVRL